MNKALSHFSYVVLPSSSCMTINLKLGSTWKAVLNKNLRTERKIRVMRKIATFLIGELATSLMTKGRTPVKHVYIISPTQTMLYILLKQLFSYKNEGRKKRHQVMPLVSLKDHGLFS